MKVLDQERSIECWIFSKLNNLYVNKTKYTAAHSWEQMGIHDIGKWDVRAEQILILLGFSCKYSIVFGWILLQRWILNAKYINIFHESVQENSVSEATKSWYILIFQHLALTVLFIYFFFHARVEFRDWYRPNNYSTVELLLSSLKIYVFDHLPAVSWL